MARRSGLGKGLSSLIPMEGGPVGETGALVGLFGESAQDCAFETFRDVGAQLARRLWLLRAVSEANGDRRIAGKRRSPGGDVVQQRAQRVDVAARVSRSSAHLLR